MRVLNAYVDARSQNGEEGQAGREIVKVYFHGDKAWFTGESETNQRRFATEMTFRRTSGSDYFAHWHGKISHRFFRVHFEWPLENENKKLEIFYLGPKITKS